MSPPPRTKVLHLHRALGWLECFIRLISISWRTDCLLLEGIPGFAVPAIVFARLFNKPFIALVAEGDLQAISRSTLGIAGRLLRMCDYAVAANEAVKQDIVSLYGLKDRKVIVLPFEEDGTEDEQIVLQIQSLLNGNN